MWFDAIAKSSDVTYYMLVKYSRLLWFVRRGAENAFNDLRHAPT